jgi:hypothetical protein
MNNINTTTDLTAASVVLDDLLCRQQCEEVYEPTDAELQAREDAIHAREMAEYEARMMEADEAACPTSEDPVDLYGGDDYYNEYIEGDHGEW